MDTVFETVTVHPSAAVVSLYSEVDTSTHARRSQAAKGAGRRGTGGGRGGEEELGGEGRGRDSRCSVGGNGGGRAAGSASAIQMERHSS